VYSITSPGLLLASVVLVALFCVAIDLSEMLLGQAGQVPVTTPPASRVSIGVQLAVAVMVLAEVTAAPEEALMTFTLSNEN